MNYKENSLNYKYTYKTLETNFVLEDVFEESCYLLQAIRYIVKNDFFNEWIVIVKRLSGEHNQKPIPEMV